MWILSGRPLLDNQADRRLYLRRAEHDVLVRSAERRLNVLLAGESGSGKTTLLRQLALGLREDDVPAVLIDGKLATDAAGFLELVRYEVGGVRSPLQEAMQLTAQAFGGRPELGGATRLLQLIESIDPGEVSERVVLLIDGLPSPEVAHTLFGRLRDELWRLPYSWIIAVDDRSRAALMQPPADAFFDRMISLGRLNGHEQRDLLERRIPKGSVRQVQPLFEASDGNPRRLLALVRDAEEGGRGVDDVLAAQVERETVASKLGRPASMLLSELEALGAASASDDELLHRLGWTRGRASQVFAELERAGLVRSESEKAPSGRPRKVYRPTSVVVES